MAKTLPDFGLITGAFYPLRLFGLLVKTPNLLIYFAIPIAVNVIISGLVYWGLIHLTGWLTTIINDYLANLLALAESSNLQWLDFLSGMMPVLNIIIRIIIFGIALILAGIVILQFGVILGAPWYGQLSEQIEKNVTGRIEIVEVSIVQDIGRAIAFELKKLLLLVAVGPIVLAINFLPAIGSVLSTIGGLCLSGTIVCLDFFDGPLERRRLKFRQKLKLVWGNLPASGTFSLVCLFLISIPLINLITIPVCVASGTMFVCDRVLPKLRAQSPS